jgi:radical SAM superfamily enzyme YgiQ (UPF0313 family)
VAGISYLEDGHAVRTPPRKLIADLDRLPLPAYDLLPMERYGRRSRNHPDFAAVELSRGCSGSCAFCVLWRQMGRLHGDRPVPQLRVKSPERALEEIRVLVRRYGRRYLGWVDPSFNAHPETPGRLAELLLKEGLRVGQSAWVRDQGILRDESSGALEACVRAGLNEVYIGIERADRQSLGALHKNGDPEGSRRALEILSRRYPAVFTVGSFIYGLPGDTPATLRQMYRFSIELDLDMVFYIPLTPLPGTPYWKPELWDPTGERFRSFDFLPEYGGNGTTNGLGRTLLRSIALDWHPRRVRWYVRRLFTREPRKRRIHRRLFLRGLGFSTRRALGAALGRAPGDGMHVPSWYES